VDKDYLKNIKLIEGRQDDTNEEETSSADDSADTAANDTAKIQATLRKVREEKSAFEKQLKELKRQFADIDVEEYRQLKAGTKKEQTAKEAYEAQLSAKDREAQTWKTKYAETKKQEAIALAFRKAGGRDEEEDGITFSQLMYNTVSSRVALDDNDRIIVVDEDGNEAFDDKGDKITLEKLMKSLAKKGATKYFFKPESKASGYGVEGTKREYAGKSKDQIKREILSDTKMAPAQKLALAREYGIE